MSIENPLEPKKKNPIRHLYRGMNWVVSVFVLGLTILLLYYMIDKLFFIWRQIFVNDFGHNEQNSWTFLRYISYSIVLIKAYTILRSYLKTHQLNIKILMEIAMIAPIIEVIFNYASHDHIMNIVFSVLALCSMTLYFIFYDRLVEINAHYQKNKKRSFFSSFEGE